MSKKIISAEKAIKITENSKGMLKQILSKIATEIEKAANKGLWEVELEMPGEEYIWYENIVGELKEKEYKISVDSKRVLGHNIVLLEISWKHLRQDAYHTMKMN